MPSRNQHSLRSRSPAAGAESSPDTALRLVLLGGFALRSEGCAVLPPHQVERLLAFLALQGRPLHRAYVAGRLWLELSQDHAHACLRTTLWRLGRLSGTVVEVSSTHVGLSAAVAIDARELEDAAERLLHEDGVPSRAALDRLVHVAELLPDWYEDWVVQERDRLRQLRLLALEAAGRRLLAAGRYPEATVAALAAVDADPLRESAHRLLISSHLGEGNVAEALRQFAVFRAALQRDLGLEPSARMTELLHGLA